MTSHASTDMLVNMKQPSSKRAYILYGSATDFIRNHNIFKRPKLRLELLGDDQSTDVAHVFVHGYRAITRKKHFELLKANILSCQPSGKVYLLFWKSGDWVASSPTIARIVWVAGKMYRYTKYLRFKTIAIELALIGLWEAGVFRYYLKSAQRHGAKLSEMIKEIPATKINLIGHSLGTVMIENALESMADNSIGISDCVFLGGVASVSQPWASHIYRHSIRIYNGYTKWDVWLSAAPVFSRVIGRNPILLDTQYDRYICNVSLGRIRHTTYWSKLPDILPKVWPEKNWR